MSKYIYIPSRYIHTEEYLIPYIGHIEVTEPNLHSSGRWINISPSYIISNIISWFSIIC